MGLYVGIDSSMRCTGVTLVNERGEWKGSTLIATRDFDDEELIKYQIDTFNDFMESTCAFQEDSIIGGAIEGLSFGSVGGSKDFLAGLQWAYRVNFFEQYGKLIGVIPVLSWRSKVLGKGDPKSGPEVKKATVDKLPEFVRTNFEKYVELNKDDLNAVKDPKIKPGSKSQKYKDCVYDICDAYWIARYRASLG